MISLAASRPHLKGSVLSDVSGPNVHALWVSERLHVQETVHIWNRELIIRYSELFSSQIRDFKLNYV